MPSSEVLPAGLARLATVRDWIRWGASRFQSAQLVYGHGTDNALDEAFHLVLHALHLPYDLPAPYLEAHLAEDERIAVHAVLQRRIDTREPAAYLIGEMMFCGAAFDVDARVLIPRSPIAELIERGFAPWLSSPPARVLDLCAGSGCIGIACALHFDCTVDLGEVDAGALEVCERNIHRHGVQDRVRAVCSDLYEALSGRRYDLIVSNPPYVPTAEWRALAPEYQHEPRLALDAGNDGMDLVARILRRAVDFLNPDGVLICEVGGSQDAFEARWPRLPVVWIEFERGGDGVFLIGRQALLEARDSL